MEGIAHRYIRVNGIQMHYVTAGSGPLLILLHGFPEFWYSWRHQIPALSPYYTVVAPDLRGYNETDKPLWGYEADVLTNDIAELIVAFGADDAVVVGHDWGGALAWMLASDHPQRVQRLIALNIPHPARFAEEIRRNGRQMLRSWYMGFFQLPLLPEALLRANDFALLEQVFRGQAVNKAAFSDADIAAYKEALRKPGALTGAINYYRGLFQARLLRRTWPVITAPTLMIWGEQDAALGKELVPGTERYVANLQTRFIPQASHWVQQDAPELVNQYLLAFLRP